MKREIRLETLLGQLVRARNHRPVGRLEEFLAENGQITEILVGERAVLARLGALGLIPVKRKSYAIRWDQLDWSDPHRLQVNCNVEDLRVL